MNALPGGTHGGISVLEPVLYDERRSVTRTFDTEVASEAGPELLDFMRGSQTRTLHLGVDGLNRPTDASEGELARLLQDPAAIRLVTPSHESRPMEPRNETGPRSMRWADHRGPTDRGLMVATRCVHGGGFQ